MASNKSKKDYGSIKVFVRIKDYNEKDSIEINENKIIIEMTKTLFLTWYLLIKSRHHINPTLIQFSN